MNAHDAFERKRSGRWGERRRTSRIAPSFRQRLNIPGELLELRLQFFFKNCKSRFGALKSLERETGCRHTDLTEGGGLIAKLFRRLLVNLPDRFPLLFDRL